MREDIIKITKENESNENNNIPTSLIYVIDI